MTIVASSDTAVLGLSPLALLVLTDSAGRATDFGSKQRPLLRLIQSRASGTDRSPVSGCLGFHLSVSFTFSNGLNVPSPVGNRFVSDAPPPKPGRWQSPRPSYYSFEHVDLTPPAVSRPTLTVRKPRRSLTISSSSNSSARALSVLFLRCRPGTQPVRPPLDLALSRRAPSRCTVGRQPSSSSH